MESFRLCNVDWTFMVLKSIIYAIQDDFLHCGN